MSESIPYADPLTRAEEKELYGQDDPFFGGKRPECIACGEEVARVNEMGVCPKCAKEE